MASLRAAHCRRVQRSGRRAGADARAGRAGRETRRVRRRYIRAPHFAGRVAVRYRDCLRPRRCARVGGPPARGHRCLRAHERGRTAGVRARRDGTCLPHRSAVGGSRSARGAGRQAVPRDPQWPLAGWMVRGDEAVASGDAFLALVAYLHAAQLAPDDAGIAGEVSGILVRLGAPFGAGMQARTRDLGIEAAQAARSRDRGRSGRSRTQVRADGRGDRADRRPPCRGRGRYASRFRAPASAAARPR